MSAAWSGFLRPTLLILAKDLRERARDRSIYLVGLVAPLGLAFILYSALGDAISGDFDVDVGVVDNDRGEVTDRFIEVLEELDEVNVNAVTGLTEVEGREMVDSEELAAVLVLPENFSRSVTSPQPGVSPEVEVIGDVNAEIGSQIARAIADGFATRVNAGRLSVAVAASDPNIDTEFADLVGGAMSQEPAVNVVDLPAGDRELTSATYLIAGITILFLFFTVQSGVTGLLDEARFGTLSRLRAAPVRRLAIPAAKALGSVVLGLVSLATLVVGSTVIMGASWGNPLVVALLGVAGVLAAVSIMGVVATFARTPEQAGSYQSLIALLLAVVGGSFFPVTQGEGILVRIAALTPHHWFLRGLGEGQESVTAALPAVGMLLGFAVVVGSVGAGLVLWRGER